ncbi:unnamed protein product [Rotaria magnacalcarata]|uniref:ADP ribosyltransferase domain-containing protein n=1 Tax=Rotaria magnacalcarata TaxID=392030 RepID=A0A816MMA6_9BILA|nr:unnamed protein product [Rotaria magnacalcarata]
MTSLDNLEYYLCSMDLLQEPRIMKYRKQWMQTLWSKDMYSNYLTKLVYRRNSIADVSIIRYSNHCCMSWSNLISIQSKQSLQEKLLLTDTNLNIIIEEMIIDDQRNIDLTIHHRLLQPAEHCYKQIEYNVASIINEDIMCMLTMLDRCYQYYQGKQTELASVNRFARQYRCQDAAHWFTKDIFLYRFVNKLFRTGDLEMFHNVRFYITHLSLQLMELKHKQQRVMKGITIVYRGLRQSEQELDMLRNLVGTVIHTKGFMSTSLNRQVALAFAGADQAQSSESQALLLEIKADWNSPLIIAANIADLSMFPDEQEVLFDIGTQLFVENLIFNSSKNIWLCTLTTQTTTYSFAPHTVDMCVEAFSTTPGIYREEDDTSSEELRYQRCHKFDQYTASPKQREFWRKCKTLPWIATRSIDMANIWLQKCVLSWQQRNVVNAEIQYDIAITIYEHDNKNRREYIDFLDFYGFLVYKSDYKRITMDFAKRSLDIRLQLMPSEGLILARLYRILGIAYLDAERSADALICHNQALIIDQNLRPTAKWSMVLTLRDIGSIHRSRGDKTQALEYFIKALDILQETCINLL